MYDKKPVKNQVMGQSLGYGFVQFQQHEHALSTLRHLNNNPDIFGPGKVQISERDDGPRPPTTATLMLIISYAHYYLFIVVFFKNFI